MMSYNLNLVVLYVQKKTESQMMNYILNGLKISFRRLTYDISSLAAERGSSYFLNSPY